MTNWQALSPQQQQQTTQQNLAAKQQSGLLGGGALDSGQIYMGGSATFDESGGRGAIPQSQDPFAIPGKIQSGMYGPSAWNSSPAQQTPQYLSAAAQAAQQIPAGGGLLGMMGSGEQPVIAPLLAQQQLPSYNPALSAYGGAEGRLAAWSNRGRRR